MILVTGGSGLVGSHLLYFLTQTNDKIRAIYRSEKKIDKVRHVFSYYTDDVETQFDKIEWIASDLNDIPSLSKSFEGITQVYHCAAFVSFDSSKDKEMRKINIEGTANIVNLCIANKVEKLCYVSSIAALGEQIESRPVDENTAWNPEADLSSYAITKYGGELEVWRATQEGIPAIIVNPGVIIGPGFWKSSSGAIFYRVYKGTKYFTSGSTGYVDIHDVVKPMIQLMSSMRKNERYVLVGENMSFENFLKLTASKLKKEPPKKSIGRGFLNFASKMDWVRSKLRNKRRRLPKSLVKSLVSKKSFSNQKVIDHLGYQFKPIEQSVEECAAFFIQDLQ